MRIKHFATLLLLVGLAAPALADVDLVTIPTRDGTQLTIYNSEDITMVREQRLLTVKQGVNRIQFSWANTLIDPTSIEFRVLDKQDKVDLVDTTFPAGRNDALQWNIQSSIAGKVPVEIRYFTSGITWSADYVGIANADETKLEMTGYVRVTNNSGELYDNTETRLVVGNVNLVEKIGDLARRPPPGGWKRMPGEDRRKLEEKFDDAAKDGEVLAFGLKKGGFGGGRGGGGGGGAGRLDGDMLEETKQVVKQGLSEYFLFAIEGREEIKDKEPKRLVALKAAEVPLECIYKLSDRSAAVVPALPPELASLVALGPGESIRFVPGTDENDARKLHETLFAGKMIRSPFRATIGKDGLYISSTDAKDLDVAEQVLKKRNQVTKFYRFKNIKLLDTKGKEKKLPSMENLGLSPLPNGTVKLYSEYKNKDLAYVGGTETKYVPIGDRVDVNVGQDRDITIERRLRDQKITNVVARQYKRRLDDQFVLYYDLIDYDETFLFEEELVSGKPMPAKVEVERQFDADVVLWGSEGEPKGWTSSTPGAYVDLHTIGGRVERVDQQHIKYFMDLPPGKKLTATYTVTYKRRKVGPELNTERKREPL